MFLKKLFLASASVLMLALAYHLGASTATAQAPSNPVVSSSVVGSSRLFVFTANGDVFVAESATGFWQRYPNVFGGSTSGATQTWGSVKVQQR